MLKKRPLIRMTLLLLCLLFLLPTSNTYAAKAECAPCSAHGVTRVLVMGVDRAAGLTDCIMIVTVNEEEKDVSILQIPRDTYANYTERSYKKLNGLLRERGEAGAKAFLSRAMGVSLDYFIILDLDCVDALVDAVGGIELEIPMDMEYSDPDQGLEISLKQGMHRLNGAQAEQFVRYRAGYANADLGRLDAQKVFLKAFAKRCNSITSAELFHIVGYTLTRLQTDMDLPTAIRMVSLFGKFDAEEIRMETLAGQAAQGSSGAWYYVLNEQGCVEAVNRLLSPDSPITQAAFDPEGIFDRVDYDEFHKIYSSPKELLPMG